MILWKDINGLLTVVLGCAIIILVVKGLLLAAQGVVLLFQFLTGR